ncbi:MAG: NAD-dependent epimerase, partial [Mesorhizobium sp.]
MRILITGAAGMVGRKLVARLAKDGALRGRKITALDLHDIVPPQAPTLAGVDVS